MTSDVYLVDAVRTPIGRHGGALAPVRPDDLLAIVLRALLERVALDGDRVDEVYAGCANQAGEDNRNVARMAVLLSGMGISVPAVTLNRLCGSGLSAVSAAYRSIAVGEAEVVIASGVESMTRSPIVMAKPSKAFQQGAPEVFDSTIGWRFVNPGMAAMHPPISMGLTAENLADKYDIGREEQDGFALRSHERAVAAQERGFYARHLVPVETRVGKTTVLVDSDESPRADASLESLARLRPAFRDGGTVTAGNSSSINDGAGAALLASGAACERWGLRPIARVVGAATAGVDPSVMGIGPVPATRKALARAGWQLEDLDSVELNEAFAAQSLAVLRDLPVPLDKVNPDGGAIALGHPLGMSGLRLVASLLQRMSDDPTVRRGLASLCIGVGQGESLLLESVVEADTGGQA